MKKNIFIAGLILSLSILVSACTGDAKDNPKREDQNKDSGSGQKVPPGDTLAIVNTKGKSVLDYFLTMPLQFVMPEKIDGEFDDEYRKKMIVEKDIANGYLKVKGIDGLEWSGYSEVVMWTRESGKDLVGILISFTGSEEFSQMLVFWEQDGDNWRDVTDKVYRAISVEEADGIYTKKIGANTRNAMTGNTEITLKLPKKGLNIEVYFDSNENGNQIKVADHSWDGKRFNLTY